MAKKKKNVEPKYLPSPMNNDMINYKVYYMSAMEKLTYFWALFIVGGLIGQVFYGGLFKVDGEATKATYLSNFIVFLVVGAVAVKVFFPIMNENLKNKRGRKLQKQFMDLLESLSSSLAAGNTVNNAFLSAKTDLSNQYSENDFIMRELAEILTGMENGQTLENMMLDFGDRSDNEDIQNFSNVMSNCYRLGGNFKDVVRRTRDVISDKVAIKEEINTKLASNKLQHNAMSIMPIILVGMMRSLNANFAANLASPVGVVATTVAIALFVVSYFWGQKIIDIR